MKGYVKQYNKKPTIFFIETEEQDYIALKDDLIEEVYDYDIVTFTPSKIYINVSYEGENGIYLSRELVTIASNVRKITKVKELK